MPVTAGPSLPLVACCRTSFVMQGNGDDDMLSPTAVQM